MAKHYQICQNKCLFLTNFEKTTPKMISQWFGLYLFRISEPNLGSPLPRQGTSRIIFLTVMVWGRAIKHGAFSEFRVNFRGQISTWSSWKLFSYLNIKFWEQLSLTTFSISIIIKKVYLVKMCPIFDDSASNRSMFIGM